MMLKRVILPLLFGLAGVAVLVSLGVWQMQRLAWKEGVLAEIESRIAAAPVALPQDAERARDRYLPVAMEGRFDEGALRVLVSQKQVGAGYRVISPFVLQDGRRVLVDRGFIKVAQEVPAVTFSPVTVTGNLHWPDDRNSSTPENDVAGNIWFARDLEPMAAELGTKPLLVVLRDNPAEQGPISPLPVDTGAIPNDHLEYAVTWFSLAVIWALMTGFLIWRMRFGARNDRQ